MPDLGTTSLINSETLTLIPHPTMRNSSNSTHTIYPNFPAKTLNLDNDNFNSNSELPISTEITTNQVSSSSSRAGVLKIRFTRMKSGDGVFNGAKKSAEVGKCLEDYVQDWKARKVASGVPENQCFFPFLMGSPRLAECRICSEYIYPSDEISCSVRGCPGIYHVKCAKDKLRCSVVKKLKCPQHACFLCKNKYNWRCVRCELSAHDKCAAWPEKVIHLSERSGWAICWKHPKNWRQEKTEAPANTLKEIFSRLPLPYTVEELSVESTLKDSSNDKLEPPAFVHIRRNVYLVKKKRDDACVDIGCTNCTSSCSEDCVCRVQCISCSKFCGCSDECTNKPFRKEKKIKLVKTELCGWGVEAAESINKGDFIIEYVGEVVDDVVCTQRLWDMKNKNVTNFYMCEIRKDFTIDATFKGNLSRFLNHSCDPNCKLEKWQVEGETRVGVFAAQSIKVGEPLTYDYRFVQFGAEVKCHCGATNCQGYLDAKRKTNLDILESKRRMHRVHLPEGLFWGLKRKRSWPTS